MEEGSVGSALSRQPDSPSASASSWDTATQGSVDEAGKKLITIGVENPQTMQEQEFSVKPDITMEEFVDLSVAEFGFVGEVDVFRSSKHGIETGEKIATAEQWAAILEQWASAGNDDLSKSKVRLNYFLASARSRLLTASGDEALAILNDLIEAADNDEGLKILVRRDFTRSITIAANMVTGQPADSTAIRLMRKIANLRDVPDPAMWEQFLEVALKKLDLVADILREQRRSLGEAADDTPLSNLGVEDQALTTQQRTVFMDEGTERVIQESLFLMLGLMQDYWVFAAAQRIVPHMDDMLVVSQHSRGSAVPQLVSYLIYRCGTAFVRHYNKQGLPAALEGKRAVLGMLATEGRAAFLFERFSSLSLHGQIGITAAVYHLFRHTYALGGAPHERLCDLVVNLLHGVRRATRTVGRNTTPKKVDRVKRLLDYAMYLVWCCIGAIGSDLPPSTLIDAGNAGRRFPGVIMSAADAADAAAATTRAGASSAGGLGETGEFGGAPYNHEAGDRPSGMQSPTEQSHNSSVSVTSDELERIALVPLEVVSTLCRLVLPYIDSVARTAVTEAANAGIDMRVYDVHELEEHYDDILPGNDDDHTGLGSMGSSDSVSKLGLESVTQAAETGAATRGKSPRGRQRQRNLRISSPARGDNVDDEEGSVGSYGHRRMMREASTDLGLPPERVMDVISESTAVAALASLAWVARKQEGIVHRFAPGLMASLLIVLRHTWSVQVQECATSLCALGARDPRACESLLRSGVFGSLRSMLRAEAGSPVLDRNMGATLLGIAVHHGHDLERILGAGLNQPGERAKTLMPAVELLHTHSRYALLLTACAIWAFARDTNNAQALGAAGAVQGIIVGLQREVDADARRCLLAALWMLTCVKENAIRAAACGAIQACVAHLHFPLQVVYNPVKTLSMGILAELCAVDEVRVLMHQFDIHEPVLQILAALDASQLEADVKEMMEAEQVERQQQEAQQQLVEAARNGLPLASLPAVRQQQQQTPMPGSRLGPMGGGLTPSSQQQQLQQEQRQQQHDAQSIPGVDDVTSPLTIGPFGGPENRDYYQDDAESSAGGSFVTKQSASGPPRAQLEGPITTTSTAMSVMSSSSSVTMSVGDENTESLPGSAAASSAPGTASGSGSHRSDLRELVQSVSGAQTPLQHLKQQAQNLHSKPATATAAALLPGSARKQRRQAGTAAPMSRAPSAPPTNGNGAAGATGGSAAPAVVEEVDLSHVYTVDSYMRTLAIQLCMIMCENDTLSHMNKFAALASPLGFEQVLCAVLMCSKDLVELEVTILALTKLALWPSCRQRMAKSGVTTGLLWRFRRDFADNRELALLALHCLLNLSVGVENQVFIARDGGLKLLSLAVSTDQLVSTTARSILANLDRNAHCRSVLYRAALTRQAKDFSDALRSKTRVRFDHELFPDGAQDDAVMQDSDKTLKGRLQRLHAPVSRQYMKWLRTTFGESEPEDYVHTQPVSSAEAHYVDLSAGAPYRLKESSTRRMAARAAAAKEGAVPALLASGPAPPLLSGDAPMVGAPPSVQPVAQRGAAAAVQPEVASAGEDGGRGSQPETVEGGGAADAGDPATGAADEAAPPMLSTDDSLEDVREPLGGADNVLGAAEARGNTALNPLSTRPSAQLLDRVKLQTPNLHPALTPTRSRQQQQRLMLDAMSDIQEEDAENDIDINDDVHAGYGQSNNADANDVLAQPTGMVNVPRSGGRAGVGSLSRDSSPSRGGRWSRAGEPRGQANPQQADDSESGAARGYRATHHNIFPYQAMAGTASAGTLDLKDELRLWQKGTIYPIIGLFLRNLRKSHSADGTGHAPLPEFDFHENVMSSELMSSAVSISDVQAKQRQEDTQHAPMGGVGGGTDAHSIASSLTHESTSALSATHKRALAKRLTEDESGASRKSSKTRTVNGLVSRTRSVEFFEPDTAAHGANEPSQVLSMPPLAINSSRPGSGIPGERSLMSRAQSVSALSRSKALAQRFPFPPCSSFSVGPSSMDWTTISHRRWEPAVSDMVELPSGLDPSVHGSFHHLPHVHGAEEHASHAHAHANTQHSQTHGTRTHSSEGHGHRSPPTKTGSMSESGTGVGASGPSSAAGAKDRGAKGASAVSKTAKLGSSVGGGGARGGTGSTAASSSPHRQLPRYNPEAFLGRQTALEMLQRQRADAMPSPHAVKMTPPKGHNVVTFHKHATHSFDLSLRRRNEELQKILHAAERTPDGWQSAARRVEKFGLDAVIAEEEEKERLRKQRLRQMRQRPQEHKKQHDEHDGHDHHGEADHRGAADRAGSAGGSSTAGGTRKRDPAEFVPPEAGDMMKGVDGPHQLNEFEHVEGCEVCRDLFPHYVTPTGKLVHLYMTSSLTCEGLDVGPFPRPTPPVTAEVALISPLPNAWNPPLCADEYGVMNPPARPREKKRDAPARSSSIFLSNVASEILSFVVMERVPEDDAVPNMTAAEEEDEFWEFTREYHAKRAAQGPGMGVGYAADDSSASNTSGPAGWGLNQANSPGHASEAEVRRMHLLRTAGMGEAMATEDMKLEKKWRIERSIFAPRSKASDSKSFLHDDVVLQKCFHADFELLLGEPRIHRFMERHNYVTNRGSGGSDNERGGANDPLAGLGMDDLAGGGSGGQSKLVSTVVDVANEEDNHGFEVPGEGDMHDVAKVLMHWYRPIMALFDYYCMKAVRGSTRGSSNIFQMPLEGFALFVKECIGGGKQFLNGEALLQIFRTINFETDKASVLSAVNEDKALMRFEFMESLLRIALDHFNLEAVLERAHRARRRRAVIQVPGAMAVVAAKKDPVETVEEFEVERESAAVPLRRLMRLIADQAPPVAVDDPDAFRESRLYRFDVEQVIGKHMSLLRLLFLIYANDGRVEPAPPAGSLDHMESGSAEPGSPTDVGSVNTTSDTSLASGSVGSEAHGRRKRRGVSQMTLDQWLEMLSDAEVIADSHRGLVTLEQARLVFWRSRMWAIDEVALAQQKVIGLNFVDFVEGLSRLVDMAYVPVISDMGMFKTTHWDKYIELMHEAPDYDGRKLSVRPRPKSATTRGWRDSRRALSSKLDLFIALLGSRFGQRAAEGTLSFGARTYDLREQYVVED